MGHARRGRSGRSGRSLALALRVQRGGEARRGSIIREGAALASSASSTALKEGVVPAQVAKTPKMASRSVLRDVSSMAMVTPPSSSRKFMPCRTEKGKRTSSLLKRWRTSEQLVDHECHVVHSARGGGAAYYIVYGVRMRVRTCLTPSAMILADVAPSASTRTVSKKRQLVSTA